MHTETSNGVEHLVDERGRCATCGRDHRDWPTGGRVGPILGELSLTVEDGTVLTARTDVALATQWAEHTLGTGWDSLTYGQQMAHVSDALAELRRAYAGDEADTPTERTTRR